jgi:phenol 2-monooxygenase
LSQLKDFSRQLGFALEGDSANIYWGVMDARKLNRGFEDVELNITFSLGPITDLPDVRVKVVLHSADSGSLLIVPRERNLVRFYIQLGTLQPGEKLVRIVFNLNQETHRLDLGQDASSQSPEKIIESARKILAPYTLECPEVEWWSVYEIGQRICKNVSYKNRVFLAGLFSFSLESSRLTLISVMHFILTPPKLGKG